jgi:ATP-dependent Clp endopeptidase proteolytic subunit ClpP
MPEMPIAVQEALVAKHKAEAAKFEAEAYRAKTEAEQLLVSLKDAEIDLRQKQRIEDELLALDSYNYTYRFTTDVNDTTVKSCIDKLTFWHRTRPEQEIEVIFNSPGGSVFAGMDLFDYICELRRDGSVVNTHGRGHMASMGGILLQAGTKRSMGRESYILIHEVSHWAMGKVGEIEDEMKFLRLVSDRVAKIFVERAREAGHNGTASHPITMAGLKRGWDRKDWWLDSAEAIKLGIVDELR